MDYNYNTEKELSLNLVNTAKLTTWNGDSRSCDPGQVIYQTITTTTNMNNALDNQTSPERLSNQNQLNIFNAPNVIKSTQNGQNPIPDTPVTDNDRCQNVSPPPQRFTFANSQTIRSSLSSSSESSDSVKTTWSKVKAGSPTKVRKDSIGQTSSDEKNSPDNSPTKNKNERGGAVMTSWKCISPSKSSSSSDLEHSNHSNHSNGCPSNRIFRFSNRMKELTDSTSSSDAELGTPKKYAKREVGLTNQNKESEGCKCNSPSDGSESEKKVSCHCNSHNVQAENRLESSTSSLCENGSPKREKVSPDEPCDNDYYYEDDFTVQFDTNLRETSVTPIESDPNTTILDFPNMVTGSYLCFHTGGSSNVSFNNSKASSNLSLNNMRGSHVIIENEVENENQRQRQYDSEFSGNSGSHNSTMEVSSSERDMMGSSDIIDLSDGPLFTPTPSNLLSSESLSKNHRVDHDHGNDGDMSGSNGSGETNLNVDCCPKKEEYFLSFDGSHSKVSGSETDISLSMTSHDSCPGHWGQSETSDCAHHTDGQEESTDSFHMCFNKLSPLHKAHQYSARENLSGRVLKKLVPLKEMIVESGDTSEEEQAKTSPTLTAGSKSLPTLSSGSQFSPTVTLKRDKDSQQKTTGVVKGKKGQKSENLYLVGIGKPVEILRKAAVHSHTVPRMKNLVSWKQLKNLQSGKKDQSKCESLPELNNSTSWSSVKCRKLSEVSESFHNKRHSASLFEFYQRMKSQSNPVSPETMSNLEQILWPNFLPQKAKCGQEMSDSSTSSAECSHCQCHRQTLAGNLPDSVTKAYTNKRIFDWLKMECSSSSRDSNRPNSLACQTANIHECFNKETIISPQTVTLWCGTKTVASQFPPVTKDFAMQTLCDSKAFKDLGVISGIGKRDQALQTSDFEEEEILSILSENFDDFNFLKSNEGIATNDVLNMSDKTFIESDLSGTRKIQRSKSADNYRRPSDRAAYVDADRSYTGKGGRSMKLGRSKSAGRLSSESPMRRMNLSKYYSVQSLPDIGFLSSSMTQEKEDSKDSLFDPMKINLPVPVTIATKTELEKFNIYQQKLNPCHKSLQCCEQCQTSKKVAVKGQTEMGESSSGISSSSASSGIDPGFCDCRSRSNESPETDLERLIFFPPHTELIRFSKSCCLPKRKSQSAPNRLSDCANSKSASNGVEVKYANEVHPKMVPGSKSHVTGRLNQKWANITLAKNVETESNENLYALEEEQTPVASPEQHCCHRNICLAGDCCPALMADGKRPYCGGERDFTESDFYRAIGKDKIIVVENDIYRGIPMNIDSTSSSGSSVPNGDRKPLKSCLRKRNRGLRSRSLSAADNLNLNFEELEEKVKNRHSYACDEVYIVSDETGQLMMYQADDSAEPVMFYLGKDGECHMTEGTHNHHENFGNYANFDIQATDSINSSNSSTERDGTSKRKSVSFASEVSFQSISPAVSPRKVVTTGVEVDAVETEGKEEADKQDGEKPEKVEEKTEGENDGSADTTTTPTTTTTNHNNMSAGTSQSSQKSEDSGCQDNQGSSSSSDSAPEIFTVAMDTNDNLWTEEVMLEKREMLMNVSEASELLIAHFAKSTDTFDKLRLGNTSETPLVGELVVTKLCSALTVVISNGLRPHLGGFQMFGRVQLTVWKLVEASVEIVPQTRSLSDLVCKVKQTAYLTSHRQKFDAFIFGLLNLRLLDFWVGYISQKQVQLARYYTSDAILLHSQSTLHTQYSDMVSTLQPLAVLPFQLNHEFLKSEDLIGSKDVIAEISANQNACNKSFGSSESTNEIPPSPMEVTSVLELTASKALTWLAKATLPKRSSMSDSKEFSQSRSKSFDTGDKQLTDSDKTLGKLTSSVSDSADLKDRKSTSEKIDVEKLTDSQKHVYTDAKTSRVDCDNLLPLTESMKSSNTSLTGSRSETLSLTQSLTQSMTSSASSLVSKILQFGSNLTQKPTATYKKGVTEYSFENEHLSDEGATQPQESSQNLAGKGQQGSSVAKVTDCSTDDSEKKEFIEEVKLRAKQTNKTENNTSAKRVSFDIVNLFDKLLLPSSKPAVDKKVTSRIPVPTNRWSWSFGQSKPTTPPSTTTTSSTVKIAPKTPTKSDSEITKREHYPKKSVQNLENSKSRKVTAAVTTSGKPSSVSAVKSNKNLSKVSGPPKPPRLVGSPDGSKRNRNITNSLPAGSTRNVQYDINKNTATL